MEDTEWESVFKPHVVGIMFFLIDAYYSMKL